MMSVLYMLRKIIEDKVGRASTHSACFVFITFFCHCTNVCIWHLMQQLLYARNLPIVKGDESDFKMKCLSSEFNLCHGLSCFTVLLKISPSDYQWVLKCMPFTDEKLTVLILWFNTKTSICVSTFKAATCYLQ